MRPVVDLELRREVLAHLRHHLVAIHARCPITLAGSRAGPTASRPTPRAARRCARRRARRPRGPRAGRRWRSRRRPSCRGRRRRRRAGRAGSRRRSGRGRVSRRRPPSAGRSSRPPSRRERVAPRGGAHGARDLARGALHRLQRDVAGEPVGDDDVHASPAEGRGPRRCPRSRCPSAPASASPASTTSGVPFPCSSPTVSRATRGRSTPSTTRREGGAEVARTGPGAGGAPRRWRPTSRNTTGTIAGRAPEAATASAGRCTP